MAARMAHNQITARTPVLCLLIPANQMLTKRLPLCKNMKKKCCVERKMNPSGKRYLMIQKIGTRVRIYKELKTHNQLNNLRIRIAQIRSNVPCAAWSPLMCRILTKSRWLKSNCLGELRNRKKMTNVSRFDQLCQLSILINLIYRRNLLVVNALIWGLSRSSNESHLVQRKNSTIFLISAY